MLVNPGDVGLALDGQMFLRSAFLFLYVRQFLGLSGGAWQAVKYSVRREGLGGESIAAGRNPRPSSPRTRGPITTGRSRCDKPGLPVFLTTRAGGYGSRVALALLACPGRQRSAGRLLRSRGAICVRVMHQRWPSEIRGRRECRVHAAPTALRANEKDARRLNTGTPKSLRHSLRNGFTAYSVISPANQHFATVTCKSPHRLVPCIGGTGPHGLTVRIDTHRLRVNSVHRIPHHVSWRSRYALLGERGTRRDIAMFPIYGKRRSLRRINATC
jgi:hypothetical protein